MLQGKCLKTPVDIRDDREIVECDGLEFPYRWNSEEGYVLIRIHDGQICVGYVDSSNTMNIEFRGVDPGKLTKAIVRRNLLNPSLLSFVSAEVVRAHYCLTHGQEYVQQ
jgi:hypothetical protein